MQRIQTIISFIILVAIIGYQKYNLGVKTASGIPDHLPGWMHSEMSYLEECIPGTDMGFPGYSVFRELELYVSAGLTPMQAIREATIVPAKVMKLSSRMGSVESGKNADLIIVNGNPLENIRDIRKVSMVIKNGNIYDPAALHKMAGFKSIN